MIVFRVDLVVVAFVGVFGLVGVLVNSCCFCLLFWLFCCLLCSMFGCWWWYLVVCVRLVVFGCLASD